MTEYSIVKIPTDFKERFEGLNNAHRLGYSSYAEFVKDAMRRRFEEIEASYHKDS